MNTRVFFALLIIAQGIAPPLHAAPGDVDVEVNAIVPPAAGDTEVEFAQSMNGITCVALQPDRKLLVGGGTLSINGATVYTIARLNADGSLDPSFTSLMAQFDIISSMAVQADGKIVIAGDFTAIGGAARAGLARLNADGSLDAAFNPGSSVVSNVLCITVQIDGKLIFGGTGTLVRVNADGTADNTFSAGVPDRGVNNIVLQPNGQMIIGGTFRALGGTAALSIARLNSNGSIDSSFAAQVNVTDTTPYVQSVAVQPDGKVLVVGNFTTVNGTARNWIARLNSNGSLDTGFTPTIGIDVGTYPSYPIMASVRLQADGRALVGGEFTVVNGLRRLGLARVSADGSVDASFNPYVGWNGLAGDPKTLMQADGRVLLLAGRIGFDTSGWLPRSSFARLHNDPASDSLRVTSSSRVQWLRGGTAPEVQQVSFELSVNNGSSWSTLGAGTRIAGGWELTGLSLPANGQVRARARADDGGLVESVLRFPGPVATTGKPTAITSTSALLHGTINANGTSTAAHFDYGTTTAYGSTLALTLTPPDGSSDLDVSATLTGLLPSTTYHVRLSVSNADGAMQSLDEFFTTPATINIFNPSPNYSVGTLAVLSDGKILVGGDFTLLSGQKRTGIARLNIDGSLDRQGFNTYLSGISVAKVYTIVPQANGKTILGGNFPTVNYGGAGRITQLLIDGIEDEASYSAFANSHVDVSAVQPDGKLVIGGGFTTMDSLSKKYLARLYPDGTLDTSFTAPSTLTINNVHGIAVQPDGRLIVAGDAIPTGGGALYPTLMRLNADGSKDSTFNAATTTATGYHCIAVQPDGRIVVGGYEFSNFVGNIVSIIWRFNSNGSLDTTFAPKAKAATGGIDIHVYSVALQADGKMVIAGGFTSINSITCNRIARLNANGSVDTTFNASADDWVVAVALQADGKVIAGGDFNTMNTLPRSHITRLLNDPATQSLSAPTAARVQWLRGGSSPETHLVTFEVSTDSGNTWTMLGPGTRITGGWQAAGLTLPASGLIRARARTPSGQYNGSSSIVESIAPFPPAPIPLITVATVTNITATGATLAGTVNPNGAATTASFQYGTTTAYGNTATLILSPNNGTSALAVNTTLTGLIPNTTYHCSLTATNSSGPASSTDFTFQTLPAPNLVVQEVPGTNLVSGSTLDFHTTYFGNTMGKTLILKNTGSADLVLGTLSIGGDFVINSTGTLTTIPAGGSTTLSLSFTPTANATRASTLHVASNDAPQNPFDLNLTGVGVTDMAFTTALQLLDETAGTVNIPITRNGSSAGAVSVRVNSAPGSAGLADYGIVSDVLVTFADGQTTANVPVTIYTDAIVEANETFALTLSSPSSGITLGSPSTITIRIVDSTDPTKPTVTITSPAANASIAEGATTNLVGTAADNKGVLKVQVALNGLAFTDAATTISANGLTASYTSPLAVVPGVNTVSVKSIDTHNNESLVTTRSFNYNVLRPLTVLIVGTGAAPLPIAASAYKVGFPYTLTAKPGTGQVFDGWTANNLTGTGITTASAELASLTFTHRDGLILTAHFKPNPFTSNIIGTFAGLVSAAIGTTASNETSGCISISVQSNGGFTGTLKQDGFALPITGTFDNAGDARFGTTRSKTIALARTGKVPLELALQLDMTGTTSKLGGSVVTRLRSVIATTSNIDADRAAYLLLKNAPSTLAGTSSKPYTLVFKHRATQPGLTTTDYPQGDGYATGTIKTDGTVSFTGKLADNTTITVSAPLSKINTWPLFAPLYASPGGSISAEMSINEDAADTDMTSSELWFRPYQSVQWYPWGWSSGIGVDIIAAHYTPAPASVFPVPLPVDALNGNATLTFRDAQPSTVIKNINLSSANVATKAPTTDAGYTFVLTPASGLISGTFTHTNLTKPTYQGVIFQKGANKAGYGYFMTVSPKIVDGLGESGGVKVLPK